MERNKGIKWWDRYKIFYLSRLRAVRRQWWGVFIVPFCTKMCSYKCAVTKWILCAVKWSISRDCST